MKNLNKTTKTILFASLMTALIIPLSGMPSVFAAESYPSWGTYQSVPNGSGCGGECYAQASSSGVNDVYAKSNWAYESRDAVVHNNAKWNPITTTTALTLTTNNSLVGMEMDTVYDGQMTTGFGSNAEFHTGLDLYKKISSNWYKVSGCYDVLIASDDLTDSQTLSCTASNAGTNDYRAGATHKAHAWNWFSGVDTIVDFYDSGSGDNNKAETDRLEICAGAC